MGLILPEKVPPPAAVVPSTDYVSVPLAGGSIGCRVRLTGALYDALSLRCHRRAPSVRAGGPAATTVRAQGDVHC